MYTSKSTPFVPDIRFIPLKVGSQYIVRHYSYTSGSPWLAVVQSVTNLCYLINGKWYLKSEFEYKYRIFEEVLLEGNLYQSVEI